MPTVAVTELLRELGGCATWGTLARICPRAAIERAVRVGDVLRLGRGVYGLAEVDEARRTAARMGGHLCLTSAALHHGWAVKTVPARPQLMFGRGRRIDDRGEADVHWGRLEPHEVSDGVTTPETTLAHCLRRLTFDEALAVADSAMRAGVPGSALIRIAEQARGAGCRQMRRVAELASPRAANPFESCLRAIAVDVPGLRVTPQLAIREPGITARPDLVDERLHIVMEADSFEWHGGRAQLRADARRYDLLVVNGWLVLRFAYEHVMGEPDFVRQMLVAAAALAQRMNECTCGARAAA